MIPCYNEERHIGRCIDSLFNNKFDRSRWEILVVDGMSSDRTREIVSQYSTRYPFVRLIDNPARIKPAALNKGILAAAGDYVMRIDAHSTYQEGYVDELMRYAKTRDVQNVGGVQVAVDQDTGFWAAAIATAVSHPLAMGDALHRMRFLKEPRFVDTVFCGCYPRRIFDEIGLFNEKLIRTQDREFNERLRLSGGRTLLIPSVQAFYEPRTNLWRYMKWVYDGAMWLFLAPKYTDVPMLRARNLVPLCFVSYLLVLAGLALSPAARTSSAAEIAALPLLLYGVSTTVAGVIAAWSRSIPTLVFTFPIVVCVTHIAYGVGSIVGWIRRYS